MLHMLSLLCGLAFLGVATLAMLPHVPSFHLPFACTEHVFSTSSRGGCFFCISFFVHHYQETYLPMVSLCLLNLVMHIFIYSKLHDSFQSSCNMCAPYCMRPCNLIIFLNNPRMPMHTQLSLNPKL